MTQTKPLAAELRRRFTSVLDGTSLTENEEVIDALVRSTTLAVGADGYSTDPLAIERFRTILTAPIEAEAGTEDYSDESIVGQILSAFPEAHFEYRTNEAGVRLRKVVVGGTWEVDPLPTWMDGTTRASEPVPPRPSLCPGTARNGAPCHAEVGHEGGHRASFPA
jgi:hypothetical protein